MAKSVKPIIAFIGVLISWLIFERKLLFALFASSASFLALNDSSVLINKLFFCRSNSYNKCSAAIFWASN